MNELELGCFDWLMFVDRTHDVAEQRPKHFSYPAKKDGACRPPAFLGYRNNDV
jgi:hypothetical protein